MNTMLKYAFSVLLLSVIVLIVGMIKPRWILLWMEKGGRMAVLMIASIIFMVGMVMYGEGNKQLQQEKEMLSKQQIEKPLAEVPVPTVTQLPAAK